jgi:hypothetical protein
VATSGVDTVVIGSGPSVVVVGAAPKLAVAVAFPLSARTHVAAVPAVLHAPLQPAKDEALAGVAVSTTDVPMSQSAEQTAPHAIPSGVLETVPDPGPVSVTERVAVFRGLGGGGGGGGAGVGGCAIWIERASPPSPPPLVPPGNANAREL